MFQYALQREGFEAVLVYDEREIHDALSRRPDVVIALSVFPGGLMPRGYDPRKCDADVFFEAVKKQDKEWGGYSLESLLLEATASGAAVIVATGSQDKKWPGIVRRYPRTALLYKPLPVRELVDTIKRLLQLAPPGCRLSPA